MSMPSSSATASAWSSWLHARQQHGHWRTGPLRPAVAPQPPSPPGAFVFAGIQIIILIILGWAFVRFKLIDGGAFMPQINVMVLRVAFPALTLYLLGIKLDLMDAEVWRSGIRERAGHTCMHLVALACWTHKWVGHEWDLHASMHVAHVCCVTSPPRCRHRQQLACRRFQQRK